MAVVPWFSGTRLGVPILSPVSAFVSNRSLVAAIAAALVALAGSAGASAATLERPRTSDVSEAARLVEGDLNLPAATRLQAAATWGGRFTTATGETVTLYFSDSYPRNDAVAQSWAEFMGRLAHGPELGAVSVYVLPLGEVQRYCGARALACFSPRSATIVTPGSDPGPGTSAEAVLAHEYGHHVAASRSNAPWLALDYGTKRWASYEQVCRDARAGLVFPGNEGAQYRLNPGEGFAEAYRVLNERRLGLLETVWEIVTRSFYPDATALARLEQDVVAPWTRTTAATFSARFRRGRARVRIHALATPNDGRASVSVTASRGLRVRLQVLAPAGRSLAAPVTSGGAAATAATVCGSRALRLKVTRLAGAGRYTLKVATP